MRTPRPLVLALLTLATTGLPPGAATAQAPRNSVSPDPLNTVLPPIVTLYPPGYAGVRNPPTSFEEGAIELLSQARVPGGVAIFTPSGLQQHEPKAYPDLLPAARTLGQALRSWLAHDRTYTIVVDRGAVDVVPSDMPPLLLTRIRRFDYSGNRTQADGALQLTPEFRTAMTSLGLHYGIQADGGLSSQTPSLPITVHMRNVTLLQALNGIARAEGNGRWVYRQRDRTYLAIRPLFTGGHP